MTDNPIADNFAPTFASAPKPDDNALFGDSPHFALVSTWDGGSPRIELEASYLDPPPADVRA